MQYVAYYLQTIEQFVKDFKIHIKYPEKVFQLTQGGWLSADALK